MGCPRTDALGDILQVEEGPATARTRNKVGLERAHPRGLKDVETKVTGKINSKRSVNADAISNPIAKQGATFRTRLDDKVILGQIVREINNDGLSERTVAQPFKKLAGAIKLILAYLQQYQSGF